MAAMMRYSLPIKPVASLISLLAVVAIEARVMAQAEQKQDTEGIKFSIHSQLVEVFVTVTHGKQPVLDLKAADFEITEDGNPVAIDRVDSREAPLQIALLVDTSESVRDSLKTIQDAAGAFVESLNPEDRVILVLFNSDIVAFTQTTENREPILKAIHNAKARGMTRLYDALLLGMKHLDGRPGRKAVVCFTDGEDTAGTVSRAAVLNVAARSGYPIYTIAAGAGLGLSRLQMILRDFAEINGGRAFSIQSLRRLRQAFTEAASELRSAYVLNYYTRIPPDGQWHELSVTTKDPAFTINARKGFFAGKP